ncbi:MAG: hypothetical protein H0V81_08365 [Solirubrobacterales bacterium]|nr:hypothetical protein [Solirubrobacterales bacterium]
MADSTDLEELLQTLLMEGYALYPYTPGATKNATPTPFGIVYPPVYAAEGPATHDRLTMVCVVVGENLEALLRASIVFLEPAGERHEGVERRIELPETSLGALLAEEVAAPFRFTTVLGRVWMAAEPLPYAGAVRVRIGIENHTDVGPGLTRQDGLRSSLMSTHVVARLSGGARFASPASPEPEHAAAVMTSAQVNTYPVLAADDDTAMLGAAIMLPDHPQLAPESSGDLFDATEIEEALRLHLLALSDGEVEEMAEQDPAVRAMLDKAIRSAPEDIVRLHGRITVGPAGSVASDTAGPYGALPFTGSVPTYGEPSALSALGLAPPSAGPIPQGPEQPETAPLPVDAERAAVFGAPRQDPEGGEDHAVVDGQLFAKGLSVVLRPTPGRGGQDHLVDGRRATVERVYVDLEQNVHLGVTIDDDPGQDIMRDIGRYHYFKPTEVEVV